MLKIMQSINGRVRWKHQELTNRQILEEIEERALKFEAIKSVRTNYHAGSIAMSYDPEVTPKKEFEKLSLSLLKEFIKVKNTPVKKRKRTYDLYSRNGALAALGLSMFFLFAKNKKLHGVFGYLFLGFLGGHMFYHRKRI